MVKNAPEQIMNLQSEAFVEGPTSLEFGDMRFYGWVAHGPPKFCYDRD